MPRYWFEDFVPGTTAGYGTKRLDKDELVAFAREYDPQPFHLDEEAAKASFVGTLIASGWNTAALHQRLACDAFITDSSCLSSPGIDELKWLKPVRPGDTLTGTREVLSARVSATKPDRGIVSIAFRLVNQQGEAVMELKNSILFALRHPGKAAPPAAAVPASAPAQEAPPRPAAPMQGIAYFDEIEPGTILELGSRTFSEDDIIAFARAYDPQGFHIDPAAAANGPFGRIIASGWHTAAGWMGCMARDRAARAEHARAEGLPAARLGPSPGFNTLRWLKPVFPGDTISYRSALMHKRPSASRPGWGLVFHHNTGVNQRGETVFSFNGAVFWERRQP